MSGAGRRHRAKHLCEAHNSDVYTLSDGEFVVRLLETRGNHYHVADQDGATMFVRLPAKFNKVVWVKRGDLLVVVKENEEEDGVIGAITHRLSGKQVKQLVRDGLIPEAFLKETSQSQIEAPAGDESNPKTTEIEEEVEEEEEEEEEDPWLRGNPNVAPRFDTDEEDEEDEES
eukprot:TRINITY_DN5049_c0_g1_i1.p1 TRINITY_DN5049_c0_g1~~TRINITY_DN5049_c0_g1_i1.p1  ORF type:complete len:189 (+),score=50.53 TRINITY_DN5049_c0_g1_i1:50-568(+)